MYFWKYMSVKDLCADKCNEYKLKKKIWFRWFENDSIVELVINMPLFENYLFNDRYYGIHDMHFVESIVFNREI